ncbi:hypothetical protein G6M87_10920 [Rhizobium rhizogenes]|uniref:hypothetical protein n=1 Tax=Rhizobium rhizogenes TaxID=359 RepID=UPI00157284A5|nr:hypothetical protein [Rhizobium rhizogenes]NTI22369.1 hypothetical protein [Rhizobium rhizogenes]QTG05955.1 hypothetical protein G6M87_10920 [Rhizobium rhizogenes]
MVGTASQIWRNWELDGVPSSGLHDPILQEIRDWGTWLEGVVSAFTSNGGLIYSTRALLFADLAHAANSMAWVIADATVANNGVYMKNGASGAGSWTRVADLPYSFVKLTDVGAGTPNAIQLTSSIPTSSSVLRVANVFENNTGNVTISENGDIAKSLLTNSGNQIPADGLVAGMMITYVDNGTSFRLISDIASAAVLAAAEDAADRAEDAAAAALAAVPSVFVLTRTAMAGLNTAVNTAAFLKEVGREGQFIWNSGNLSTAVTGDPQQGIYVPPTSDTTGASGAWVRVYDPGTIFAKWFGSKGDAGTTDNTVPINQALLHLPATGGKVILERGLHTHTGSIILGNGSVGVVSTRSGMILEGQGQPPMPTTVFGTFTNEPATALIYNGVSAVPQISLQGPLMGWGVKNLYLSGAGVATVNINVLSSQFGDCENLTLVGSTAAAINSTTVQANVGGITNTDSLHNRWANISIVTGTTGVARGIIIAGRGTDAVGSNTDYNYFTNVVIWNGNAANASAQGVYFGASDSNQFHCLHPIGFATGQAIVFDYGVTTGGAWPASNMFWGTDLGGSSVSNVGTPGNLARPNEFFGSIDTNGGNYPRGLPNLYTALPQEIYNTQLTGQTAAVGLQSAYQVRQTGMFRVSYYLAITTAGTGGTLQVYVNYNDGQNVGFEQGSATLAATGGVLAGHFVCECAALGSYAANEILKWRVAFNSVTGTPAFKVRIVIERL